MTTWFPNPNYQKPSFNCPRCGALASQTWTNLMKDADEGDADQDWPKLVADAAEQYEDWGNPIQTPPPNWTASRCFACKNYSLWIGGEQVFPDPAREQVDASHEPLEMMPHIAADLFREAVAVLPHSKRAAAALCRASLESLVKSVDSDCPARAKLDDRLVRLESRVSTSTMETLNVLRHVGNTALHGERDDDESAVMFLEDTDGVIAETFLAAINLLVDELIVKPARSAELYKTLPDGVRKSYEDKVRRAKQSK